MGIKQSEHKLRPLSELKLWEKNPRRGTKEQMAKLRKKIERNGFYKALVTTPDGTIVGGNMRYRILKAMGETEVWCSIFEPRDEAHMIEVAISDNESDGEWVQEELAELVHSQPVELELYTVHLNQPLTLSKLLEREIEVEQDVTPKVAKGDPISELGKIYQLGQHRLMCGDSTDGTMVNALLGGVVPKLMVTDPPYGVKYDADWRDETETQRANSRSGDVLNDDRVDWTDAYELFGGNIAYIWHSALHTHEVAAHLQSLGYNLISQIIWVKQHFVMSRGDYHWQHEPCWYAVKQDALHNWQGDRSQTSVWEIANSNPFTGHGNSDDMKTDHGTQKPIECMARPIINNTQAGDAVYDPFGGSGTTLIAAQQLNRVCYMMELDPRYCDVIRKRYAKLVGQDDWQEATPVIID